MTEVIKPSPLSPIVTQNGESELTMTLWMENVTNLLTANGTGSPESVVNGVVGRGYVDTAGAPGSVFYVKQLSDIGGDTTQGWVLIG